MYVKYLPNWPFHINVTPLNPPSSQSSTQYICLFFSVALFKFNPSQNKNPLKTITRQYKNQSLFQTYHIFFCFNTFSNLSLISGNWPNQPTVVINTGWPQDNKYPVCLFACNLITKRIICRKKISNKKVGASWVLSK